MNAWCPFCGKDHARGVCLTSMPTTTVVQNATLGDLHQPTKPEEPLGAGAASRKGELIAEAYHFHCQWHRNADFEVCGDLACRLAVCLEGREK